MMIERQIKSGKESENGTAREDSRVTAGAECSIERRFEMITLSVELGRGILPHSATGDAVRERVAMVSRVSKNGCMGEKGGSLLSSTREGLRTIVVFIPAGISRLSSPVVL